MVEDREARSQKLEKTHCAVCPLYALLISHYALRPMSQTKHQIEALLAEAGAQPRHRFGQNFMIDRNLVRLVAEAGELTRNDWVLEVGPGTGTLTEELLERAGSVVAVEIDRDLAELLRKRLGDRQNFR